MVPPAYTPVLRGACELLWVAPNLAAGAPAEDLDLDLERQLGQPERLDRLLGQPERHGGSGGAPQTALSALLIGQKGLHPWLYAGLGKNGLLWQLSLEQPFVVVLRDTPITCDFEIMGNDIGTAIGVERRSNQGRNG